MQTAPPSHAQLGYSVRRLRRARRLTIETLADAAQMHPTYLSGIERGRRNPTWTKLCALACALDVPVSAIVEIAESQSIRIERTNPDELELIRRALRSPGSDFKRAH